MRFLGLDLPLGEELDLDLGGGDEVGGVADAEVPSVGLVSIGEVDRFLSERYGCDVLGWDLFEATLGILI